MLLCAALIGAVIALQAPADAKTDGLLGAHLIGAEATEMLGELSLGITLEATIGELEETIHSHPTLSEMVKEAAEVAAGHPLHL